MVYKGIKKSSTFVRMKQKASRIIYFLLITFFSFLSISSQAKEKRPISDSIRFSLLTCAPGEEIYSLFGHTAIRYENFTRGIDVVFNYGMFSFNTPNFILRFALGKTDYQLGVNSYEQFVFEYKYLERDVWQQTLNLLPEEKEHLVRSLEENYLPENRTYRYNFFYDNCATRPRDQIEKAVNGKLQYADDMLNNNTGKSFRDIIHQYTKGHDWAKFGMDLCLGSKADKPINRRLMMFAPFYVKDFFQSAKIVDRQERYLVLKTTKIVEVNNAKEEKHTSCITPMQASLSLFFFITLITLIGIYKKRTLWGVDLILFASAGLAGSILSFLALFSQHPAVSPNYLLFIFHPFHLLFLPWIIKRVKNRQKCLYMMLNLLVLTLFILFWAVIPQRFNLAILPLALCLWIRSMNNLFITFKKHK
ncbi:MAG: DUF4105 domain-containing protein [Bacteroides sp.]|jgi:hypothetical protein|nr:DUF4105 domain-containing protein [Bacteroides sp.]MCI1683351.1 DUF4105 domain-containing protein [Bacteroides sp.]